MPTASAIKHYTAACDKPMGLVPGTAARVLFKGNVETTDQRPLIDGTITAMVQRSDGGYDVTFTYDTATIPVDFLMVFPTAAIDGNVADPDPFEEGDWAWKVNQLGAANLTPALTGDVSSVAGQTAVTLNTVNPDDGTFGSVTDIPIIEVNGKGLVTGASTIPIVIASVTDLGAGVGDALELDVGTAGAPVVMDGAGGTPSAIVLTNGTGLPVATGISGLGAGVATFLGYDPDIGGGFVSRNGNIGTPTGTGTNITGIPPANVTGTAVTLAGVESLTNKTISGTSVTMSSTILSSGASAGIGYTTGAGATVPQTGSRTNGVSLARVCGTITTHTAILAAGASETFTVTNTVVAIGDVVILAIRSGQTNKATRVNVTRVAADAFDITVTNNHASIAEVGAIVINFAIIKAVTA